MPRFFTLASSSSGNASCLAEGKSALLFDCGISSAAVCRGLESSNIDPDSLSALLITHEHIDHTKGLSVFLKRHPVPLYATAPVIRLLKKEGRIPEGATVCEISPEEPFFVGDFEILPFATSHDSVGSLGFLVQSGDRSAAILTDTGHVSEEMMHHIEGADLVLLESNYDPGMLRVGHYPFPLKKRIEGPFGHLSNLQASEIAARLFRLGTTRFVLGHISKENNLPQLALQATLSSIQEAGGREGIDFLLSAAPPDQPLSVCIF